ncbi:hypothetical protein LSTR_LSTR001808, partial [Laodelphax striatellus]
MEVARFIRIRRLFESQQQPTVLAMTMAKPPFSSDKSQLWAAKLSQNLLRSTELYQQMLAGGYRRVISKSTIAADVIEQMGVWNTSFWSSNKSFEKSTKTAVRFIRGVSFDPDYLLTSLFHQSNVPASYDGLNQISVK